MKYFHDKDGLNKTITLLYLGLYTICFVYIPKPEPVPNYCIFDCFNEITEGFSKIPRVDLSKRFMTLEKLK